MKIERKHLRLAGLAPAFAFAAGIAQAQAQDQPPHGNEIAYNGEAGRIINENCVVCHREGGIGPMAFESYEQVRPWAPLIQFRVANREMPPYAYDHGIGIQQLEGDWRLSREDIGHAGRLGRSGRPARRSGHGIAAAGRARSR